MVNFWKGNDSEFKLIQSKNPETIYFIFDTFKIYLGDAELSNNNTTDISNYELYVEEAEKSTVWNTSNDEVLPPVTVYDDDTTYLTIKVQDGELNDSFPRMVKLGGDNYISVDWGDGTPVENFPGPGDGRLMHNYTADGEYYIKLKHNNKASVMCYMSFPHLPKQIIKIHKVGKCSDVCFGYSHIHTIDKGAFDNLTDITTFLNLFAGCTSLTSIPAGLFDKCANVTDFNSCFKGCSNLSELPGKLFKHTNPRGAAFPYLFESCSSLKSVPSDLFEGCVNLDVMPSVFRYTGLTEVPAGLFNDLGSVTSFTGVFYGCSSLSKIGEGLMDKCVNATEVDNMFANTYVNHEYNLTSPNKKKLWERNGDGDGAVISSFTGFASGTPDIFKNSFPADWK